MHHPEEMPIFNIYWQGRILMCHYRQPVGVCRGQWTQAVLRENLHSYLLGSDSQHSDVFLLNYYCHVVLVCKTWVKPQPPKFYPQLSKFISRHIFIQITKHTKVGKNQIMYNKSSKICHAIIATMQLLGLVTSTSHCGAELKLMLIQS